ERHEHVLNYFAINAGTCPGHNTTPSHRWPFSPGRLRLRIAEGAMLRSPGLSEAIRGGEGYRGRGLLGRCRVDETFPGPPSAPMMERHFPPHGVQEFNLADNSRADLDH